MPAEIDVYIERFNALCDRCNLEPEYREKLFNANFKWARDSVIKAAVSLINKTQQELHDYHELVQSIFPASVQNWIKQRTRPMMVMSPGKIDHLRVYPNIVFDPSELGSSENIRITDAETILGGFIHSYQEDMTDKIPGTSEKWKTQERIDKRLGAFEDMPTARALTRFYNLEDNFKPDIIRDLATKFDNCRKPMELLYADKPEDFLIMYGSGPSSCMVHSTYKETWVPLDKAGQTPTSFYAYFPWTRGAYMMKGGKVVARTILFADNTAPPFDMGYPKFNKKAEKWSYGRLYTTNQEMTREFLKALKSNGYHPINPNSGDGMNGRYTPPEGVEFRIPGIKISNKNYIMPFPYFDNMDYHGKGFCAAFDDKTNEFVMVYQSRPNQKAVPINGRGGFLKSSDYIQKECDHCHGHSSVEGRWLEGRWYTAEEDGTLYCSEDHIKAAGYTRVVTGDTTPVWRKVPDPENYYQSPDGIVFSNRAAAERHGYRLPMIEMGVFAEELGAPMIARGNYQHADMQGHLYLTQLRSEEAVYVNPQFPINRRKAQKEVLFDLDDEPLVIAAA